MQQIASFTGSQAATLVSAHWIAALPGDVKDELLRSVSRYPIKQGQTLFQREDEADAVYAVVEGLALSRAISSDGREIILRYYKPGSWFGEVAVLHGVRRMWDTVAQEDSVMAYLPQAAFERLLERFPDFSRALLKLEAARLSSMFGAYTDITLSSLEQRFAVTLTRLGEHFGRRTLLGVEITVPIAQDSLGKLMGTTRQRINQLLRQWEAAGLIKLNYRRIEIIEQRKLLALAHPV